MIEVLPTIPSTFSLWISFRASEATWPGSVCSVSIEYWIGRPLMPPLSLTQSKYAFAVFGMSVKSVPGCFVAMPPSLMGVPLAFLPLPRPHFAAAVLSPPFAGVLCAELLLAPDDELELELEPPPPPPHAATVRATAATTAGRTERVRADLRSIRMAPPRPSDGFTAVLLRGRRRAPRARAAGCRRPAGRASRGPPRGSRRGRAGRRPRAAG